MLRSILDLINFPKLLAFYTFTYFTTGLYGNAKKSLMYFAYPTLGLRTQSTRKKAIRVKIGRNRITIYNQWFAHLLFYVVQEYDLQTVGINDNVHDKSALEKDQK